MFRWFRVAGLTAGALLSLVCARAQSEGSAKSFQQCNTTLLMQQVRDLKFALGEPFIRESFLKTEVNEQRAYQIPDCAALEAAADALIQRVLLGEAGYSEADFAQVMAANESPTTFQNCGDLLHHQGTNYRTVAVAGTCWFAEPLRALKLADGTPLTEVRNPSAWIGTNTASWAVYDNVRSYADQTGLLYNGWAATSSICPAGWHVSNRSDWQTVLRVHNREPLALKAKGWDGSNATGMNLTAGGFRSAEDGAFEFWGSSAAFWTSDAGGYLFSITSGNVPAALVAQPKSTGASIVCVQDAPR